MSDNDDVELDLTETTDKADLVEPDHEADDNDGQDPEATEKEEK